MTGLETIALANAALSLFESLVPKLKELTQSGEITVEEQAELKERYERLKNNPRRNLLREPMDEVGREREPFADW